MQVSRHDRRIRFEKSTPTPNSTGQPIDAWATFASRWARRRPLTAREAFAAQQFQAIAPVAYEVRHDATVRQVTATETFRIVDQGRPYNIRGVTESESRRESIVFLAEARAEVAPV